MLKSNSSAGSRAMTEARGAAACITSRLPPGFGIGLNAINPEGLGAEPPEAPLFTHRFSARPENDGACAWKSRNNQLRGCSADGAHVRAGPYWRLDGFLHEVGEFS
jgi:hypothetical protein